MELDIHAVAETEAVAASAVVQSSFIKLAAADWEPTAQQWFLVQSSPELLAEKLRVATFASGAFAGGQMVGFLLMPTPTLLGMLRSGCVRASQERFGKAHAIISSRRSRQ